MDRNVFFQLTNLFTHGFLQKGSCGSFSDGEQFEVVLLNHLADDIISLPGPFLRFLFYICILFPGWFTDTGDGT